MQWRHIASVAFALLLSACSCEPDKTVAEIPEDGGLQCKPGEVARGGQCFCQFDSACAEGQFCEAVTGTCQPKPPELPPDGGTTVTCISGATRCAPAPNRAVQECQMGAWVDKEVCPADGICTASATGFYCTICAPGATRCKTATSTETCSEKGDTWDETVCPNDAESGMPSACVASKCQVCKPGAIRCSADGKSVETCSMDGSAFVAQYCYPTGKCDPATKACVPPFCTPGARQCKDATTIQECAADGTQFVDKDCRTLDQWATPVAQCQNNDCYDPCGQAARESSYLGCDYWATVTSNSELDAKFKGGATDGTQPSATSEYAVVVSNPNQVDVNLKVTRRVGGAEQVSPSNPAANASGFIVIPKGQLVTVRLPWAEVGGTGRAPYAYHLVTDAPINAYQFNPVTSVQGNGFNAVNSYSNDASMLVPSHILGTSYVVLGQEHITLRADGVTACDSDADCPGPGNKCTGVFFKSCTSPPVVPVPAFFSVVATEDGTQVSVKFSAATVKTRAGGNGGIAAQAKNSSGTYTLNKYDVLQFWTDVDGNAAQCTTIAANGFDQVCRYNSDPTGTILTSTKPVAVFSGADCTFKPYNQFACDHIEEEMVPFATWGRSYAGAKSVTYKNKNNNPVSSPAPDYWRVVAACGKGSCPKGTKFTISPPPASILQSQYCSGGSCTLPAVDPAAGVSTAPWIEFTHNGDFTVMADQPIMLSQFFTGENANSGSVEGDPSLILTPPIEQWRTSYNVLTAPTIGHNYLSLIAQSTNPGITINGRALTAGNFPGLQTNTILGGFSVFRVPVNGGPQSISATSKVGVTVYGYDPYVSYGYTGGLDLQKITQINPGG